MNGAVSPSISEYTDSQLQQLDALKTWINTQNKFRGRTDEDFLVTFLYGCKFDLEKTKKKITMYYESRKKFPQWLAHRDIREPNLQLTLQLKVTTVLIDKDPHLPTLVFTAFSRVDQNENLFDQHGKVLSLVIEIAIRRRNCQLNGVIWLIDCAGYKFWFLKRFLSPILNYNLIQGLYLSMPVRMKSINVVNTPAIVLAIWAIAKPFFPKKLRNRVHFYKSGWSQLHNTVPSELLPEEYGGRSDPLSVHEDAFLDEVNSLNEYFIDDNKYGFTT